MDPVQVQTETPPVKKHKSSHHHHSEKKAKKHKHKHSHSHSRSHGDGGNTPVVKKEVVSPLKKKPMISESDSEDTAAVNHVVRVKSENGSSEVPKPAAAAMVAEVKEEKPTLMTVAEMKVKTEHGNNVDKSHVTKSSATPKKSSKSATPKKHKSSSKSKPKPPVSEVKPIAGKKRKRGSASSESDYDDDDDDYDDDFKPSAAKKSKVTPSSRARRSSAATPTVKKEKKVAMTPASSKKSSAKSTPVGAKSKTPKTQATASPVKGGRKKKEEPAEVWKWWEEEPHPDGIKWLTLEHKGPCFAPLYERLPSSVKFVYNGQPMELSEKAEEAAGFFAKMLEHDYTSKEVFCNNFFHDWRKEMTAKEAAKITDLSLCNFQHMHDYYKEKSEQRKAMSKEEKLKIKEQNEQLVEEYGWCLIDDHKEKIGNFKIEPPGLFRGRGDHPKQGKIKRRIEAEDVTINIGKKATLPKAPEGHKWKQITSDNKVTWLASWTENIQGATKYVMLNPTSRLKGEKDWAKYETARRLKQHVDKIRAQYSEDLKSKEMKIRQRAVALYFIDKLALRAGNEKDSDESADTVGCCSLRVEHITTHEEKDGKSYVIEFDFLGKDSIRYYNSVPVEKQVFKNVNLFMKDKAPGDDLFDRLTTMILNKHLSELMDGLTAKVFRTYNASKTLQEQLDELTNEEDVIPSKILSYNRANRAVAILCNHQRAPPKTFDQQMSNLQGKIQAKEDAITEVTDEVKAIKKEFRSSKDSRVAKKLDTKKRQLARMEEQLQKLEVQATDKQENKEIALGTSKLNYLDPRISVAWCKKWEVPMEKVYNKTQRQKFAWAIDMAGEDFIF